MNNIDIPEKVIILCNGVKTETVLYDADPNCEHEEDERCYSGIKCKHCPAWFCY